MIFLIQQNNLLRRVLPLTRRDLPTFRKLDGIKVIVVKQGSYFFYDWKISILSRRTFNKEKQNIIYTAVDQNTMQHSEAFKPFLK